MSSLGLPSLINPLVTKSYRERVRLKHALTWGVVVIVVSGFIYAITYFVGTIQANLTGIDSHKLALAALLVLQAIILMLIGTGSVATGVVQERSSGVLDYQRMTPMSPTSKILGYLFGLPAREYLLAALVMPFVVVAAISSQVSFVNLLQLYIVGMTSVWLYHMMGMVAGIVAPRPWKAGVATQAMVLITYFVLPMLGRWGFTFFLYLTPRPVFSKLAIEELNVPSNILSRHVDIPDSDNVPFFWLEFHPTVFTVLVQAFLILSLFTIVYRKWKEETKHPFTKLYSLVFYAGVQIALLGSLWPWLTSAARFDEVARRLQNLNGMGLPGSRLGDVMIGMLLSVFFAVSGAAILLMVSMITPNRHMYAKGIRRAKKLGLPRNSRTNDFADAMPYTIAFVLMTCVSYGMLVGLAIDSGRFFSRTPTLWQLAMPALIFAGMAIYMQGLRTRWGKRGLTMGLFIVWIIPFLLCITLIVAKMPTITALYVGSPMPVMSLMYCITYLFEGLMTSPMSEDMVLLNNAGALTVFTVFVNTLLAVLVGMTASKHFKGIRERELQRDAPVPPVPIKV